MRIWIDLANSPHVPFFNAIRRELINLGHEVEFTARDFAETVALAEQSQLNATTIGGYGGRRVAGKAGNLAGRVQDVSILPSAITPIRKFLPLAVCGCLPLP